MHRLINTLREHRHVFIVVILLTIVTTFPTIVFVFKTDVFWHPGGAFLDTYIKFWDIWYGEQFLTGQTDPFFTNLMFYPEGLSLAFHPFFIPHIIVANLISVFLPAANAYSLTYLLISMLCSLSAYVYLYWLFKDKWIALLGAVVFGLSPHVVSHSHQPEIACIATIPLAVYCLHSGIKENRRVLVALAGLLTGLTTLVTLYMYVCLLILLGFLAFGLAFARWRDKTFWLNITLLIVTVSLSSLWRIQPMLTSTESLNSALSWNGDIERKSDLIAFLVNPNNPVLGSHIKSLLRIQLAEPHDQGSYLGYLPLLLVCVGLISRFTRRKMLPWAVICCVFLILRLGSHLQINGTAYLDIPLPKYYLNQLLPLVFSAFREADHFMMGALLPFAVLTCYGLVAFRKHFASAAKPGAVLALIAIVALEYHIPVRTDRIFPVGDGRISKERLAFLDWLEQEDGEIRLINLPMGQKNSKIYNLYQALNGYPHAEGFISRTPDRAYDYIRANPLLNAWHQHMPISCESVDRNAYLSSLAQLEADGFSHVVYHPGFLDSELVKDSFRYILPAHENEYVWIFRLNQFRDSCNEALSPNQSFARAYADALRLSTLVDNEHGIILVFPPSNRASYSLSRDLHHFSGIDRIAVSVTLDEAANIKSRRLESSNANSSIELEDQAALWLVNSPHTFDATQTPAFRDWFAERFHFCRRAHEDAGAVVDLYLQVDIPCSAMDKSSALEVEYDGGARLHNLSFAVERDLLRFYLAWSYTVWDKLAFSLQFFDEHNQKALQYDHVIRRQLLSAHEIDISSLRPGDYSIQLIVYDFETLISRGGTITETGQRFPRELEIGRIDVKT